MSLIHSSLGWGMLLGAIPIIIYIIFRRRYRVVRWAAMELLLAAIRRKYRHLRLQDFILLALRTVALIVAALAIARPVLSGSPGGPGRNRSGSTSDAVILLDTSYSMGTTVGGQTRLDRAKRRAQAILSALPQGSRVAIDCMTNKVTPATDGLADIARARMAIEAANVTAEATDALPALTAALETLKSSKATDKRVFIVTDAQALAFESQIDKLRNLLAGADDTVRFTVATTTDNPSANVAVTKIEVASRWLRPGVPIEFKVTLQDLGEATSGETHVEFWVDGRKVERKQWRVASGETEGTSPLTTRHSPLATASPSSVSFRHTFGAAGIYSIEARLDADVLGADNHRYTAVCIPANMDMLVVEGDQWRVVSGETEGTSLLTTRHSPLAPRGAGAFVEAAMNGGAQLAPDVPGLAWTVRPPIGRDRLASELDPSVWCVVLADPGPLSSDALERLGEFVQEGGSVIVSCGPEFTATLGAMRSGRGRGADWMSGLTIEPPASQPAGDASASWPVLGPVVHRAGDRPARPDALGSAIFDLSSPGIRESMSAVHVFRSITAAPSGHSRWTSALSFTDGRPALLVAEGGQVRLPRRRSPLNEPPDGGGPSGAFGTIEPDPVFPRGGRLALWVSSLDATWCDLPYRPAFVTMLHDLTAWLSRPRLVADTLQPGESWSPVIPGAAGKARTAATAWKIVTPDSSRLEASLFVERGQVRLPRSGPSGAFGTIEPDPLSVLNVDRTNRPGVYRLERASGGGRGVETAMQTVVVNVDTRESDPRAWSRAQLLELFPHQRANVVDETGGQVRLPRRRSPLNEPPDGGGPSGAFGTIEPDPLTAALTTQMGREIWPMLAVLLGCLLLVETLLAYRFSYQKSVAPPASHTRQSAPSEGASS